MTHRKNLFVTVGTTRFDSLIREITSKDSLETLVQLGFTDMKLQIGKTDYEPKTTHTTHSNTSLPHLSYYRLKDSITDDIEEAHLVVCHAGAGSIIDSLGAGKPVLVVINDELMGNHQTEVAEKLAKDGYLHYCNVSSLTESLKSFDFSHLKSFPSGQPHKFVESLDKALGFV